MASKIDFNQVKNKTLNGLNDVNAPSPSNGDALLWNSAVQKWVPGAMSGGGGGGCSLTVTDDGNGNITIGLANTSSGLSVNDDNNGNITISLT